MASWDNLVIKSSIVTNELWMRTTHPDSHSIGARISESGVDFLSIIKMLANFIYLTFSAMLFPSIVSRVMGTQTGACR